MRAVLPCTLPRQPLPPLQPPQSPGSAPDRLSGPHRCEPGSARSETTCNQQARSSNRTQQWNLQAISVSSKVPPGSCHRFPSRLALRHEISRSSPICTNPTSSCSSYGSSPAETSFHFYEELYVFDEDSRRLQSTPTRCRRRTDSVNGAFSWPCAKTEAESDDSSGCAQCFG